LLSNHLIEEHHLRHRAVNEMLERFHRNGNAVVVATDLVANYVRNRFPRYKLILSVIPACLDRVERMPRDAVAEYYASRYELYDEITVPPEFIQSRSILEILKPHKTIHLLNNYCTFLCWSRREHHEKVAHENMGIPYPDTHISCGAMKLRCYPDQGLFSRLLDMGYRKFKLQGREKELDVEVFDYELRKWLELGNLMIAASPPAPPRTPSEYSESPEYANPP
jgi:hypothetical protein